MDSSRWNSAICDAGGDFMQSTEWGVFQRAMGRKVISIDAGGILSQGIVRPLGYGREEIYVPMGPVPYSAKTDAGAHLQTLLTKKSEGTIFLECDLLTSLSGFGPTGGETRQPRSVSIVDIEGMSQDQILQRFHATLKENIARANRYKLSVVKESSWEGFYELYLQTMKRHGLRPWHVEYMETLWETLRASGMVEIWSCGDGSDLLASNMYVLFNGRATHLFGGTSAQKRETMAPHFLHLAMMSSFSERGFKEYDLGKVDPEKLKNLTEFKERFGGKRKTYPGNFRYIISPFWYRMYRLLKR